MGLYSHSIHLHVADKEHGRHVASALLKSAHSLVLSTPYANWINVYLPLGLSYKDVPELPTSTYIELNCYNSEGFDLRLYAQDRLALLFESGCGDVSEEEERLLEIAEDLWRKDPNKPVAAPKVAPQQDEDAEAVASALAREGTFWDLPQEKQDEYVARARKSSEFESFVDQATQPGELAADLSPLEPFLPAGRDFVELQTLLSAASKRLYGPPRDERERIVTERWMRGKNHSALGEDYVQAIADFLELKGALWSLESLQQQRGDKIDRRIVRIEELAEAPTA